MNDDIHTVFKNITGRESCRDFRVSIEEARLPPFVRTYLRLAADGAPYASGGPRRVLPPPRKGEELASACFDQQWVYQASDAWLFCGKDPDAMLRSGHPKYIFDCSAACMCMDLMAVSMGYGTCWIGHFDPDAIRKVYGLDETLIPTIILLVGERAEL